jgi:uncharacterized LabA/DUF88 family protein
MSNLSYRLSIFIDFWNFQLSINEIVNIKIDWQKLPQVLIQEASKTLSSTHTIIFQTMNVYLSYNPASHNDKKLVGWAKGVLSKFPGTQVILTERKAIKSPPQCPNCYRKIIQCPGCGSDMRGTHEKGVDTRIATDMIRLAWENTYDVAILASNDADFVPVIQFLHTKGIKIIHAAFPPLGSHLTQESWSSISIPTILNQLSR